MYNLRSKAIAFIINLSKLVTTDFFINKYNKKK